MLAPSLRLMKHIEVSKEVPRSGHVEAHQRRSLVEISQTNLPLWKNAFLDF